MIQTAPPEGFSCGDYAILSDLGCTESCGNWAAGDFIAELRLPFWLVSDRNHQAPPAAFTTSDNLKAFLDSHQSGRWRLSLISDREAIILAVADAHAAGMNLVCIDPNPDPLKSDSIKLVDLMDLAR